MTSSSRHRQANAAGGLPQLILWGGVFLMIAGGVIAYPTLQGYLMPTATPDIEFVITLMPTPVVEVLPTATFAAPPPEFLPTATFAAPPPDLLPEMEIAPPGEQVTPESQTAPESTGEPQATPMPTLLVEPTRLSSSQAQDEATLPVTQAAFLPSRLVIPAIGLDAPIVPVGWETRIINGQEVSLWDVLNLFAVGWHINSARPGQGGNVVFSGHHNIYGEVFRDLEHLQPLDDITVYIGETAFHYSVTALRILEEEGQPLEVRKQNASCMLPTDYERLTLVTCWPYSDNTHRLVIIALPTQPIE